MPQFIYFFTFAVVLKELDWKMLRDTDFGLHVILLIVALAVSLILSYCGINEGIYYYIAGSIGVLGISQLSILLRKSKILQSLGRASLVIMCVHGPIYRVFIKIFSVIMKVNIVYIRENIFLSLLISLIVLGVCYVIYLICVRFFPLLIGSVSRIYK